jgi:hypothetical protein
MLKTCGTCQKLAANAETLWRMLKTCGKTLKSSFKNEFNVQASTENGTSYPSFDLKTSDSPSM